MGFDLPHYSWDFGSVFDQLPVLLSGVRLTFILAAVVMALSLPLGLAVAFARMARWHVLSVPAYLYTEAFRTTPLLVQLVWFYFILPTTFGLHLTAFTTGVIAFTANVSAFLAEVFRGSILSIDRGQSEAAIATGMNGLEAMRRVILPQALLRAVPLVVAIWIGLFKDTSLVAVIGIHDLMYEARGISLDTYRPVETLTVAALLYFALTYPQSIVVNRLFNRFRVVE